MPKETPIMTSYIVAVHLIVEADANPGTEIGGVLDAMLTQNMRKYLGTHSALIDWAVAGPDIAASIALFDVSNLYSRRKPLPGLAGISASTAGAVEDGNVMMSPHDFTRLGVDGESP
ncbi:hypothetical protein [Devosia psychrophila]|uniref:hypothetical protein n=1 Tax=Devosia psychrophila TaxID=728005 RepID=UPI0006993D44|nr:hypothetical protein [Devosia psychrophila]